MDGPGITVIQPKSGWQFIDFRELREYRDLFYFLVRRDIRVLYAQTVLGFAWAILNPLLQIAIFSLIFGKVAKVSADGLPYVLFSSVAIIPWTYMSEAMNYSSQSLVTGQGMLGKIYFPRLLFPLTPVFSKLVDFGISLVILLGMFVWFRVTPSWNLLWLPVFMAMMIAVPAAAGMWLSSLAIRYRDVKFAMHYIVRMLMYSAPIVYSAASLSEPYRMIYSLNPLVGVIEGFRASLLGLPVQWQFVWPGMVTTVLLLAGGAFYFRRMERILADVI